MRKDLTHNSACNVLTPRIIPYADTQFAYLAGIRDFVTKKIEYLKSQVGNPEGADKPNKKVSPPLL